MPTLYATTEQLKRRLNTTGGGGAAADEPLLDELLEAASDRVRELAADRTLSPVPALEGDPLADTAPPATKTFPVFSALVQVPDLRDVESVSLDGNPVTAYSLRTPVGEGADRRFLRIRLRGYHPVAYYDGYDAGVALDGDPPELTIVGRWGPLTVQSFVRDAVLTWAARAWHARTARFADAVQDPAGGMAASYFRAVPADVAGALALLDVPGV